MRVLSFVNIIVGLFLFFALSGITQWGWFPSRGSATMAFIVSMLMIGNGLLLGYSEIIGRKQYSK